MERWTIGIFILILLLFSGIGLLLTQIAQIQTIPHVCTYEINTDGKNIFSWNCLKNSLFLKSTNASYIFQQTLNTMANTTTKGLSANGGILFISIGNYTFCCTVTIQGGYPKNLLRSVVIRGSEKGLGTANGAFSALTNQGTTLFYSGLTGSLFHFVNAARNISNNKTLFVTFEDLGISGTTAAFTKQNATTGISFTGLVSDILFSNFYEFGLGNGISINASNPTLGSSPFNFFMSNSWIEDNYGCGLLVNDAAIALLFETYFFTNNNNIAIINSSRDVIIQSSTIRNSQSDNILINGSFRTQIIGNTIENAGSAPVNNRCFARQSPSGPSGISIIKSNNITVTGNYIGNSILPAATNQKVGIYLNASKDVSITGNTFGNNTVAQIQGLGIRDLAMGNIGFNPQPVSSVTAGASVWTYQNVDGYQESMLLTATNGISAETCNTVTTSFTVGTLCPLAIGQTLTATWTVTAPVFEKIPQ